eukprot:CAMPEP_0117028066 /NCGR_PEP_ID=MMETSP0472-20121206/20442_1 /TAXON_ID=693140 ORGANISM="Tiarina fusus, Strain LIS" /NCGR_SAMPLE_ID=MMETSP0472 /ASSEMBLY_ACC=CAM_ASM_000603 /LENGTH=312 /DNA_ID=CAMNT_0004735455 /DNA_START=86 /DNA_END=1021 /DNA_ORIENTATION=+
MDWTTLSTGSWKVTGEAQVIWDKTSGTMTAYFQDLKLMDGNTQFQGAFKAHVHNQACENNNAGGHWMLNPDGGAVPTNELWILGTATTGDFTGDTVQTGTLMTMARIGQLQSFVIHNDATGAKEACVNLQFRGDHIASCFESKISKDMKNSVGDYCKGEIPSSMKVCAFDQAEADDFRNQRLAAVTGMNKEKCIAEANNYCTGINATSSNKENKGLCCQIPSMCSSKGNSDQCKSEGHSTGYITADHAGYCCGECLDLEDRYGCKKPKDKNIIFNYRSYCAWHCANKPCLSAASSARASLGLVVVSLLGALA